MKCKACGSELITGTKKCPYCGALNNVAVKKASTVFDWSKSGFSDKSNKKKDVFIDWNAGKIFDRSSGQVYDQEQNSWSEPEDVKDLFSFDSRHEEYQEVLDRQVESISASESDRINADASSRMSGLPSSMDMGILNSLIDDNTDISIVTESGEEYSIDGFAGQVSSSEESIKSSVYEKTHDNERDAKNTENQENGTETPDDDNAAGYSAVSSVSAGGKESSYTDEEEDTVFKSLKKLMDAEEKFKCDMERVSYITPEETAMAVKIEEKNSRLTFVPDISFRSIEDEYASYCDDNGIKHPEIIEEPEKIQKDKPEGRHEGQAERISENDGEKNRNLTLKDRFKRTDKNKDKAVEIKINEPSGTKVTVKTQEISLAAASRGKENEKTREVNMEEVVNTPKNLHVSVEVNAAKGNASVEVTRRHDGATVVRTVDEGNHENLYVDDEKVSGDTQESSEESESSFWERSENTPRMTITDIFGPEARRILNQIDRAYNGDESEKDIENSLILDINPEDIAMTADQTAALYALSSDMSEEDDAQSTGEDAEIPDDAGEDSDVGSDLPEGNPETEPDGGDTELSGDAGENKSEDSDDEYTEETAENDESHESGCIKEDLSDKETVQDDEADVSAENESAGEKQENAAEDDGTVLNLWDDSKAAAVRSSVSADEDSENNTGGGADTDVENADEGNPESRESEADKAEVSEHTEESVHIQEETVHISVDDSSSDEIPDLEKTRPIIKAEKAIMKEAARQKKRAEKAKQQLLKENETEESGFGGFVKALIVILIIIVVFEFAIIGIKLYMPDSQAAVLIEKIEVTAVETVKRLTGGESPDAQDISDNADNGTDTQTPDGGQSTGSGDGAAPAGSE